MNKETFGNRGGYEGVGYGPHGDKNLDDVESDYYSNGKDADAYGFDDPEENGVDFNNPEKNGEDIDGEEFNHAALREVKKIERGNEGQIGYTANRRRNLAEEVRDGVDSLRKIEELEDRIKTLLLQAEKIRVAKKQKEEAERQIEEAKRQIEEAENRIEIAGKQMHAFASEIGKQMDTPESPSTSSIKQQPVGEMGDVRHNGNGGNMNERYHVDKFGFVHFDQQDAIDANRNIG